LLIKCRRLDDLEESLSDMTVHDMLERYPVLAQEIKDEIEAGIWHPTDSGYKISDAKAVQETAH
jgi:hypothetical protein